MVLKPLRNNKNLLKGGKMKKIVWYLNEFGEEVDLDEFESPYDVFSWAYGIDASTFDMHFMKGNMCLADYDWLFKRGKVGIKITIPYSKKNLKYVENATNHYGIVKVEEAD